MLVLNAATRGAAAGAGKLLGFVQQQDRGPAFPGGGLQEVVEVEQEDRPVPGTGPERLSLGASASAALRILSPGLPRLSEVSSAWSSTARGDGQLAIGKNRASSHCYAVRPSGSAAAAGQAPRSPEAADFTTFMEAEFRK